jgi:hypothetical protein
MRKVKLKHFVYSLAITAKSVALLAFFSEVRNQAWSRCCRFVSPMSTLNKLICQYNWKDEFFYFIFSYIF